MFRLSLALNPPVPLSKGGTFFPGQRFPRELSDGNTFFYIWFLLCNGGQAGCPTSRLKQLTNNK
jgi:hypothetical protein